MSRLRGWRASVWAVRGLPIIASAVFATSVVSAEETSRYETPYKIETLAGPRGKLTKAAANRQMRLPEAVAVDAAGNVYVADDSYAVRKITPKGDVSILAGSRTKLGYVDAAGASARFGAIGGLAVDAKGNVYVADVGNGALRKINAKGVVSTVAKASTWRGIEGLAVHTDGTIYAASWSDHVIYKASSSGKLSVFAGRKGKAGKANGTGTKARFRRPVAVAVDASGNVFVSDQGNYAVRKITSAGVVTTLAGKRSEEGYVDAKGSKARFSNLGGLSVDSAGNILVADWYNNALRKITPAGLVTTLNRVVPGFADGKLDEALFVQPGAIAVGSNGSIYIADSGNDAIRTVAANGKVKTLAGPTRKGLVNDKGAKARFRFPTGVAATDKGVVYVADYGNRVIRKITAKGVTSTVAIKHEGLFRPADVALGSDGSLYIADAGGHTIRRLTSKGALTLVAGSPGLAGADDGNGTAARFSSPRALAVHPSGAIFVADTGNRVLRKIAVSGAVTTIVLPIEDWLGTKKPSTPLSVAVALDGTTYVGTAEGYLVELDQDGALKKVHSRYYPNSKNDEEWTPFEGPLAVAVAPDRTLYVADRGSGTVHILSKSGSMLTGSIYAGSYGEYGAIDGVSSAARFRGPSGIAVNAKGTLYIADQLNSSVRVGKLAPPQINYSGTIVVTKGEETVFSPFWGASSISVKNLPKGLRYHKEWRTIYGTPTKSGTYKVKMVAKNKGGSTSATLTIRVNARPTISAIPDQVIPKNGSLKVAFTVNDDFTSPSKLKVTVYTEDPQMLPKSNLKLGGSGKKRTLKITPKPGKTGENYLQLRVHDGNLPTWVRFKVTVTP